MAGIKDLIEVYRGESLLNRKFPDFKGDTIAPKKVRGRWFTKNKDMAKYFAKEFPSIVKSVKIPESSFNIGKKLQKAAKLGLYSNPSEFLLPKNQMSKVKINLLQTVLANANALSPLALKGLTYLSSLPVATATMFLQSTPANSDEINMKLEDFAKLNEGSGNVDKALPVEVGRYIMARFAKGSRALAISDRSGAAFPYREMVKEWTGAWVHVSEFEPKQPQLEPHPVGADPQGLLHARPARTEFPVQDILPNNPFTTNSNTTLNVSYPSNQINEGTSYVRFQAVKSRVGGVAIATLELSTTLNGAINDVVTSIDLVDASQFPTSGFFMIEKVNVQTGKFDNEVIQYTGKNVNQLTGCSTSSAPFRGVTPPTTTASSHPNGAKVFGSYLATAIATTVEVGPTLPNGTQATEQQFNSITVPLVNAAGSSETGGGFQCTIGPLNDRA